MMHFLQWPVFQRCAVRKHVFSWLFMFLSKVPNLFVPLRIVNLLPEFSKRQFRSSGVDLVHFLVRQFPGRRVEIKLFLESLSVSTRGDRDRAFLKAPFQQDLSSVI